MKREKTEIDLITYKKLEDETYFNIIDNAHTICSLLRIPKKASFCILQLYLNELKKVTYEEVMSYDRLLDTDYYNEIKQIADGAKPQDKIIKFPKMN